MERGFFVVVVASFLAELRQGFRVCLLIKVDNIRVDEKAVYIKPSKTSECVHSPERPVTPVSVAPR